MSDDLRAEYTRKLNEGISRFLETLQPPEGLDVKQCPPQTAQFYEFKPPQLTGEEVIYPLRRVVISRSSDGTAASVFVCKEGEHAPMLHIRDDYNNEPMPYLPLLLAQVLTEIAQFYLWVAERSKILIVRKPFEVKSETYFDSLKTLYRCSGRYGWEAEDEQNHIPPGRRVFGDQL